MTELMILTSRAAVELGIRRKDLDDIIQKKIVETDPSHTRIYRRLYGDLKAQRNQAGTKKNLLTLVHAAQESGLGMGAMNSIYDYGIKLSPETAPLYKPERYKYLDYRDGIVKLKAEAFFQYLIAPNLIIDPKALQDNPNGIKLPTRLLRREAMEQLLEVLKAYHTEVVYDKHGRTYTPKIKEPEKKS